MQGSYYPSHPLVEKRKSDIQEAKFIEELAAFLTYQAEQRHLSSGQMANILFEMASLPAYLKDYHEWNKKRKRKDT